MKTQSSLFTSWESFNSFFFFSCRRNCRGNPNCLVGIGEHIWLGEIDENSFHNIDDPNCERRKKVSEWLWVVAMSVVHFLCSETCDVDMYHSSGGRPCSHPQNSLSVLKKKQKGKKEITTNAQTVNHFGNLCRCQNWRLHGPVHWWNSLFLILESLGKP